MSAIAETFARLLASDAVIGWEQLDATLKTQIAQAVPDATPCVVYPTTAEVMAEVVACAQSNGWQLLPCGQGSKLHWGGLATHVDAVVAKLHRLIEHASGDLTVTAEAGLPLAELQARLATAGQFLPVDPAYANQATLGGIVATADTGALRQRYGGIRDLLIGIEFVRSDGKLTKAGGRVVKNVAGYDLMKLFTGSYGTLGILTQATFRIYPVPASSQTILLTGAASAIAQALAALLASSLTPTAIELLTPAMMAALQFGQQSSQTIGMLVRFQSIDVSVSQQSTLFVQLGEQLGLNALCIQMADEPLLWQRLSEQINPAASDGSITCKIGVKPSQAVAILQQQPIATKGVIHGSSGIGIVHVQMTSVAESSAELVRLRHLCEQNGGFLTVLAAPVELKQRFEVWGYSGNALPLMRRLKTQFDPDNLLSPARFVGQI
jgi:glycolate oxidase FAD binding subunit